MTCYRKVEEAADQLYELTRRQRYLHTTIAELPPATITCQLLTTLTRYSFNSSSDSSGVAESGLRGYKELIDNVYNNLGRKIEDRKIDKMLRIFATC